ncbi:MAG: hypothetical protein PHO30_08445 [Candidatus Omnitrophica bacterium]|nr:hypothetical protein [Candidatus Omnitrophota bacterium]
MRKKWLDNKGLSFVEVMMATMVLAIIMACLFVVYQAASNMASLALHKLAATAWAESQIELRKSDYSTLGWSITDPGTSVITGLHSGAFSWAIDDSTTYPGLRWWQIFVTWTE